MSTSFDIICLQEIWLLNSELGLLNSVVPGMHGFGVSPTDAAAGFVRGRPHGGVAFLCSDSVLSMTRVMFTGNTWSIALQCTNAQQDSITIVNVYLPCDTYENVDLYSECLGSLSAFISDISSKFVIVGDFNCDPRSVSPCGGLLAGFCLDEQLELADSCLPSGTYTYVSDAWHTTSWIDHCLVSQSARCLPTNFSVSLSSTSSDHLPLVFDIGFDFRVTPSLTDFNIRPKPCKIKFCDQPAAAIRDYTECVRQYVSMIDVRDFNVIYCDNIHCCLPDHRQQLDTLFNVLSDCMLRAASDCLGQSSSDSKHQKGMPGWNEHVKEAHAVAKDAFQLWQAWNKPKFGPVYELFRRSRASYKYAIRYCKRHEDMHKAEKLAASLSHKNYNSFWSLVARTRGGSGTLPPSVGAASGPENVCRMWHDQYCALFSSVVSSHELTDEFLQKHCNFETTYDHSVSVNEVREIVAHMALGKAADHLGLQLEHFRFASDSLFVLLALCLSAVFCHGHMPKGSAHSVITPVLKDKNGDVSDPANYRPIALVTIFSKVLEHIIVRRMEDVIDTTPNQFGFKKRHSTLMPVLLLKDMLKFYQQHGSNMYVAFLDVSKAFDRVRYATLFEKLSRKLPGILLRLLIAWYSSQTACILWAGFTSDPFDVLNGVRQGGVLSPLLFNVYIDDLSISLNAIYAGCCLGKSLINHLLYADDIVLFAPSAKGLQKLLDACTLFAAEHDVIFNQTKSQVMLIQSYQPSYANLCFRLSNMILSFTSHYKYLGHLITSDLCDDDDISKQIRSLYARANMILRKFSAASVQTKVVLFNAFCSPIYGCQLWHNYRKESLNRLRVAYNNALRLLLKMPRWTSASGLFVTNGAITFHAIIRRYEFSFMHSLTVSDNQLIKSFHESDRFLQSPLLSKWRHDLYV
jgi:exonuclease III